VRIAAPPRVLFAEFTALPGRRGEVVALISALRDHVRQEPGNLQFAVSTRANSPESFFVYEEYRDEAAFEQHRNAAYGATFNAALGELIVEPESVLTWLDPV
jgi:quinol monooxygenase YgiN